MAASTPVLPVWAARVIRFALPPLVLVAAVLGVWHFDRTGQPVTRNAVYVGVVLLWPLVWFVFAFLQAREEVWGGWSGRRRVECAVVRGTVYTWVSSLLALVALPVLKIAGHGFGYRVLLAYVAVVTVTLFGTVLLMQRIPGSGDGYPSGGSWPL